MAGDWIKMRGNLWDDPRVSRVCDLTGQGEAAVIGGLYWLWNTADQHSEDGRLPTITAKTIDRKSGVPGLGAALIDVGWIVEDEAGIEVVRFDEHNGASAKRRAMEAKRKGFVRRVSASGADKNGTPCGGDAELEKEKEKEKEKEEKKEKTGRVPRPENIEKQVWSDFLAMRRAKGATLNKTAWGRIKSQLDKGEEKGYRANDMLAEAVAAGWQGFQLEWYEKRVGGRAQPSTQADSRFRGLV